VPKKKVLFICVHNSARSQMAEALLKRLAGDRFEVESAGLEPGKLNPLAVEAMGELGIDISRNKTKSVFDLYRQGKKYDYVITVCDQSQSQGCPIFPSTVKTFHWAFEDPSRFDGPHDEKLARVRGIRDLINAKISEWAKEAY